MAKNKFNKSWMNSHLSDPYVKLAQKEDYRSRAVYKLKEIDEETGLIGRGQVVVDLGASPGSWSQYVARKMGKNAAEMSGTLIGIDILPMEPVAGGRFLQGDFREEETLRQLEAMLEGKKADLILSDMAPNLSGVASSDAARMADLLEMALDFARMHLKENGVFLAKCFHGAGYNEILAGFRAQFQSVVSRKPKASRARSPEIYLLGKKLKKQEEKPKAP